MNHINNFLSIFTFKAYSMCHVTTVELIKLKILLYFLFIDIIQYNKYNFIDISQFSFFSKILGPKMGLNVPRQSDVNIVKEKINLLLIYPLFTGLVNLSLVVSFFIWEKSSIILTAIIRTVLLKANSVRSKNILLIVSKTIIYLSTKV